MMSELTQEILQKYYPNSSNELIIGNLSTESLAKKYGTPLYIYDAAVLRQQLAKVNDAFSGCVQPLFALKANPGLAVTQIFKASGAGAEIASSGELHIVKKAGFEPDLVHFAGPAKTIHELEQAIQYGVGSINVESWKEFKRICTVTDKLGISANTAIRIQPNTALSGSRMRMGGGQQKFGVDADDVTDLAKAMRDEPTINFRGLHIYAGTQCFNAASWMGNARYILDVANTLETEHKLEVNHINFGGGFGVAYFEGDKHFDLEYAGAELQKLIAEQSVKRNYYVELGRYLTAAAGTYLTRTVETKLVGNKRHIIVDGGLHQHSAAAGMGSVISRPYPVVNASVLHPESAEDDSDEEENIMKTCIGGCLCTPADEFVADSQLQVSEDNQLIAILMSGAYGWSFSNLHFLSHPTPAEIIVDGQQTHLARSASNDTDLLLQQNALTE